MVQILICLVSILTYGLAPFGFSYSLRKGFATTTNLEKRFITYPVKQVEYFTLIFINGTLV